MLEPLQAGIAISMGEGTERVLIERLWRFTRVHLHHLEEGTPADRCFEPVNLSGCHQPGSEPVHFLHGVLVPDIMPPYHLVQIQREVFSGNVLPVDGVICVLQGRPEGFKTIGVGLAVDVFTLAVDDILVVATHFTCLYTGAPSL